VSPQTRHLLLRLVSAQVCVHACMTGFRMAAPLMALREGESAAAAGVLLALFALSQVFLALPAGRYVDRHGLHRPMAWAVAIAVSGGMVATAWPIYGVLCVTALTCGAASGLALIALQRQVGLLARDATELRQVFSWLALGPSASNFFGPLTAGVLIDLYGFRAAYCVLGLLPLVGWLVMRRVPVPQAATRTDAAHVPSPWSLFRQVQFRRLLLINWVLASCWDVHTFLVPVIGHELAFSATAIGAILGAFAVAATLVRLLIPVVAARLNEAHVVAGAMVSTAALFAVYPLVSSPWAMGALSVFVGFALGAVQPMIMSTLHQITPHHQHGQALALRAMAINGSSVLMPMLFGTVGAAVGAAWVFWTVGACVGLGSRLAWLHLGPVTVHSLGAGLTAEGHKASNADAGPPPDGRG
jgi:MFS family permease